MIGNDEGKKKKFSLHVAVNCGDTRDKQEVLVSKKRHDCQSAFAFDLPVNTCNSKPIMPASACMVEKSKTSFRADRDRLASQILSVSACLEALRFDRI